MARLTAKTWRATEADLPALETLWIESRVAAGQSTEWAQRAVSAGRLRSAVGRTDVTIYLAGDEGGPAAFAVLTVSPLSGLADGPAVWMDQLYVRPQARRKGLAVALMGAAERHAEEVGANQLISCVPNTMREMNRFLARWGFVSSAVLRSTTPGTLRRRLDPEPRIGKAAAIVAHRRSLRARGRLGAVS